MEAAVCQSKHYPALFGTFFTRTRWWWYSVNWTESAGESTGTTAHISVCFQLQIELHSRIFTSCWATHTWTQCRGDPAQVCVGPSFILFFKFSDSICIMKMCTLTAVSPLHTGLKSPKEKKVKPKAACRESRVWFLHFPTGALVHSNMCNGYNPKISYWCNFKTLMVENQRRASVATLHPEIL